MSQEDNNNQERKQQNLVSLHRYGKQEYKEDIDIRIQKSSKMDLI